MLRKVLTLIFAASLVAGVGTTSKAQDLRRGTAGANYLLVPQTAHTISVGTGLTSGLSTVNGVEALYANPAGVTVNQGTSALFSHLNYVADIGVNALGFAHRLGANQIGITLSAMDYGDIPFTTEENPEFSDPAPGVADEQFETYSPTSIVLGLTYARQFTDRIAAGITVNGLRETIDDMRSSGISFNAGMTYVVGESGLRFGVSLKNFGPKMEFSGNGLVRSGDIVGQRPDAQDRAVTIDADGYELPSLLNFGVSYRNDFSQSLSATVLGNFRSNSYDQNKYSGGLELGYRDLLYVRGGYQFTDDMNYTMYTGTNLGAGLTFGVADTNLSVDYAYRFVEYFDDVQAITASVTL